MHDQEGWRASCLNFRAVKDNKLHTALESPVFLQKLELVRQNKKGYKITHGFGDASIPTETRTCAPKQNSSFEEINPRPGEQQDLSEPVDKTDRTLRSGLRPSDSSCCRNIGNLNLFKEYLFPLLLQTLICATHVMWSTTAGSGGRRKYESASRGATHQDAVFALFSRCCLKRRNSVKIAQK